jgi:hypothetical protein
MKLSKEIEKTVQNFLDSIQESIKTPILIDDSWHERNAEIESCALIFFAKNRVKNCKGGVMDIKVTNGKSCLDFKYREKILSCANNKMKNAWGGKNTEWSGTESCIMKNVIIATHPMIEREIPTDEVLNSIKESKNIIEAIQWWSSEMTEFTIGLINHNGKFKEIDDFAHEFWNSCVTCVKENQEQKRNLVDLYVKICNISPIISPYAAKLISESGGVNGSDILSDLQFGDIESVRNAIHLIKEGNCNPYLKIGHRDEDSNFEVREVEKEKTSILEWLVSLKKIDLEGRFAQEGQILSRLIQEYDNRMEANELAKLVSVKAKKSRSSL